MTCINDERGPRKKTYMSNYDPLIRIIEQVVNQHSA